jgi:hypothetical protein
MSELDECYLCSKEIADHVMCVNIGADDPDTITMHQACFASAPWKKLTEESKVEMFVSVEHMPQGSLELSNFPQRKIYTMGDGMVTSINKCMKGEVPIPSQVVRADK